MYQIPPSAFLSPKILGIVPDNAIHPCLGYAEPQLRALPVQNGGSSWPFKKPPHPWLQKTTSKPRPPLICWHVRVLLIFTRCNYNVVTYESYSRVRTLSGRRLEVAGYLASATGRQRVARGYGGLGHMSHRPPLRRHGQRIWCVLSAYHGP